jgi:hypothetical protein
MHVTYIIAQSIYTNKFTMKYKLEGNIRNKETYIIVTVQ